MQPEDQSLLLRVADVLDGRERVSNLRRESLAFELRTLAALRIENEKLKDRLRAEALAPPTPAAKGTDVYPQPEAIRAQSAEATTPGAAEITGSIDALRDLSREELIALVQGLNDVVHGRITPWAEALATDKLRLVDREDVCCNHRPHVSRVCELGRSGCTIKHRAEALAPSTDTGPETP